MNGTQEFGPYPALLPYTVFTHTGRFSVTTNTSMLLSVPRHGCRPPPPHARNPNPHPWDTPSQVSCILRASRFVLPVSQVPVAFAGGSFLYYQTVSCFAAATSECSSGLPFDDVAFLVVPLTSGSMVSYSITDGVYTTSHGAWCAWARGCGAS